MILGIAMILLVISFEIILIRIDTRIDMIMKDLGVEDKSKIKEIIKKIKEK